MIENQSGGTNTEPPTAGRTQSDAPGATTMNQGELGVLTHQFNSSTSWFYWIAGLSMVNSIVAVSGGNWRMIVGLGVTSVADGLSFQSDATAKAISFIFTLLMAGLFAIFGVLAKKFFHWAFIVGMVVYALDGLLLLLIPDYLALAFHAFVLYLLIKGFSASKKLSELKRGQAL